MKLNMTFLSTRLSPEIGLKMLVYAELTRDMELDSLTGLLVLKHQNLFLITFWRLIFYI